MYAEIKKHSMLYIMLLPAIFTILLFNYVPMYGVIIAFKEFWITQGIIGSPWVGFDNFEAIFGLKKFWEVMRNTIEISMLRLLFGFPAPILLALLLNEVRHAFFKRAVQTIVYLPHFISWVTISGIMFILLSNEGLVNSILHGIGAEKIKFLSNNELFRPLVIVSALWKEVGWGTIIYLAAIAGVSADLYEAARVDGASRFKQMLHITLPSIAPVTTMLLILSVGNLMSGGGFDQIYNMYNPMVYKSGDIIDTYIFRIGLTEGRYSMATAVGLFLNLINFVLLLTANKIAQKTSGNNIY